MNEEIVDAPLILENKNQNIFLNVKSEQVSKNVKKLLDVNLKWKEGDGYKLVESEITITHKHNKKGIKLVYYHMKQETKPKGVIFTVHGGGASQELSFSWLANTAAARGYDVIGLEQEGHSKNVPNRQDRCILSNFQTYVFNVAYFIDEMLKNESERFEDCPLFIMGMSLGGGTVGNVLCNPELRRISSKLSGAVLWAPLVEAVQKPNWLAFQTLKLVSAAFPMMEIGSGSEDVQWSVSYDKWYWDWFKNHELSTTNPLRLGTGREYIKLGDYFGKHCGKVTTPLLIIMGDKDNLVSYDSVWKMFQETQSKVKTFVRMKDILHGLPHDHCTQDVISISLQWIDFRVDDSFGNNHSKCKSGKEETEETEGEEEEEIAKVVNQKKNWNK